MRKIASVLLLLVLAFSLVACGGKAPSVDVETYDPAAAAKAWMEDQIENNTLFAFDYDGKAYANHIKGWDKMVETTDEGWTLTYKKGSVTAWSEIVFDEEMAALEWTNYFKNEGSENSPVIGNIQAISSSVFVEDPIFTSAKGSIPDITDFQRITVDLAETSEYTIASNGGRSSQGAFPYFDISNGQYGVIGGIGWTGDWRATFTHNNGQVSIVAGMQKTNIALLANEQIRTPMITLQFFKGDQDDGHNTFRQLVLKSYTPSDETGEPIKALPMTLGVWSGYSEEYVLDYAKAFVSGGYEFDVLWLDAGWYGNQSSDASDDVWHRQVGNWYFIPEGYPNGNIKNVSDYLHDNDKKLLLWFEPERAIKGTKLTEEHPEYFFDAKESTDFMLIKLSEDKVCDYMIDWIGGLLQENGVDWYRQDFNMDPALYWSAEDAKQGEDRVGITEIKYITNQYRFLDGLLEKNPGLLIDNCASGGKRLDLEMMKRSVPLWRTDYTTSSTKDASTQEGVRAIGMNLSWWLPLSDAGWSPNSSTTLYDWRNAACTGMHHRTTASAVWVEEYALCREMMVGDFYILKQGYKMDNEDNISTSDACYQYYLEDEGKGYIFACHPNAGESTVITYLLKGLDPQATYNLSVSMMSKHTLSLTGQELMEDGLSITYYGKESSYIIFYEKAQ